MATFEKSPSGWRVKVRLSGTSVSKTFPTKAQASAWATEKEAEILAGTHGSIPDKQVSDLIVKYLSEVVIHKKVPERKSLGLIGCLVLEKKWMVLKESWILLGL